MTNRIERAAHLVKTLTPHQLALMVAELEEKVSAIEDATGINMAAAVAPDEWALVGLEPVTSEEKIAEHLLMPFAGGEV